MIHKRIRCRGGLGPHGSLDIEDGQCKSVARIMLADIVQRLC
jgi:hypothetical protein